MPFTKDHEDKIEKMYTDLYLGKSREDPSITTRLAIQEDFIDRLSRNINKLVWLAVVALLGVLGDIVKSYVAK